MLNGYSKTLVDLRIEAHCVLFTESACFKLLKLNLQIQKVRSRKQERNRVPDDYGENFQAFFGALPWAMGKPPGWMEGGG